MANTTALAISLTIAATIALLAGLLYYPLTLRQDVCHSWPLIFNTFR